MNDMTAWGHVLLAEDNPVNQRVTRAMLEHLGFHVDLVGDGAEAVNAAATTPYRAILLDCQLPVLDGYLAANEIRRWQGASRRTPIIAVTASAKESDEDRCLAAGMDAYLTKPLTLDALSVALARWAPDGPLPSCNSNPTPGSSRGPSAGFSSGSSDESRAGALVSRSAPIASGPVDVPQVAVPLRPALDAQIVDRLERMGNEAGEDLMGQLATMFLADADEQVAGLRASLAANDAGAVFRSAHTLRGASANLGATGLSRLFTALTLDSEAGDLERGAVLIDGIEAEVARVREALGAWSVTS